MDLSSQEQDVARLPVQEYSDHWLCLLTHVTTLATLTSVVWNIFSETEVLCVPNNINNDPHKDVWAVQMIILYV